MIIQRTELKYFLPISLYLPFRKALVPFTQKDPIVGKRKSYTVHSLYYDTPNFCYYRDKLEGEDVRKKFRIRYYNQDEKVDPRPTWIEIKQKKGAIIKKLRHRTDSDHTLEDLTGETNLGELQKICFEYHLRQLHPVVKISYRREPLQGLFDNKLRITFDYDVKASMANRFSTQPTKNEVFILSPFCYLVEIKMSDAIPTWLSRAIEAFDLRVTAYSKYVHGIDHCHVIRRLRGEIHEF